MKNFKFDKLLMHTTVLFSAMMAVHLCNMAYQMAVSRILPGEEYALLAAFIGVLTIIARPLSTLDTGMNHYSSLLLQSGRAGDVKRLLCKWLLLTGVPAFLLGAVAVLFNQPVAGFFHLNRFAPVLIAGAVLPALFWLPILSGSAQGLQHFGWYAAALIAGALSRFLLGAGLVWLVYPACGWAMLGHGAGMYVSVAVLMAGLFIFLRHRPAGSEPLPSLRVYLLQIFFIQIAYAVLMTADVIFVKHYLAEETGFAYAATLGRMVAFLPAAVAMAMFPKVSSAGETTSEHKSVFLHAFVYTALFAAAAAAGCALMPGFFLRILFGITDAPARLEGMVRIMALVMTFSALLNVAMQFLLAQRKFKASGVILLAAAGYLLSAFYFHQTVGQIMGAAGLFNLLALAGVLWFIFRLKTADAERQQGSGSNNKFSFTEGNKGKRSI